ncbi:DUF6799 domain-containing protein [Hymenobacter actinosclerus]|uniref:DUF6799 domain-containing protein n=1 Tax=Hymenobacter actinosclerus TaxID=82805 RepID=A0A1I0BB48_9BACT|nr:DUF6799 domain-containing protein [Hymenobacter actinosclerus]SET03320.1 hypothetical protein SAMN04487998_0982 [Hymenobacter actinosclerus]
MKKILCALLLGLAAAPALHAQTKPAAEVAGPVETQPTDRFMLQDGQVVQVRGRRPMPLTKNVLLSNGTKINYKNGIVELPGGKITTLKAGDYVRPNGDIVFGSPASAAQARGDSSVPTATEFSNYTDPRPAPGNAAAMEARLNEMNGKIGLMAQKIGLLNQKISLLSTSGKAADTSALDSQIQAIDARLK